MAHPIDLSRPRASRVEAFSDGVFAIIITLLVLELKVPHLHDALSSAEAWETLKTLSPKLLSFIISFIYVAIFWVNHHHFFIAITHIDRGFMWLNNFVLLFLSFIPFPTAFIGDYPYNATALAFFAVVLMSAAVIFNIMWRYAIYKKLLIDSIDPALIEQSKRRGIAGPVCYAIAAIVAFWIPILAWIIFIVLPLYYFLPMKWVERR